jgi:hypothetical protein
MWFEPKSVVSFHSPTRICHVEDIPPFLFKWDTRAIVDAYRYFEDKWQMDITEGGKWPDYLVFLNSRLGLFPRMFPNVLGIFLDQVCQGLRAGLALPVKLMRSLRAHRLQRGAWGE